MEMAIEDYVCSLLLSRCGHALLATGNGLEVADMRRGRERGLVWHSRAYKWTCESLLQISPTLEDSKPSTQEVGAVFMPVHIRDKFEYS